MSKTWETKRRILQLLSGKSKTLSILSAELDLAPSTVSEHIEELENVGAVRRVDNPFIKKWKYYERNPDFNPADLDAHARGAGNGVKIAAGLAVIVGLIAAFVVYAPAMGGAPGAASTVGFLLTDPPQVPAGTQALNITYSSLQAHVIDTSNTAASGWINGTGGGSLDLMQLLNVTQDIGSANIPANAEINAVRFRIANASIVVNGTAYKAVVPSGNLTASVIGAASANTSILLDLSPVVVSIFTNNTAAFVLVPSVKAVIVGNQSVQPTGAKKMLNAVETRQLYAAPGITITNASLSVSGNSTVLSVTVKNDANESVNISHVTLFGIGASAVAARDANTSIGDNANNIPVAIGDGQAIGVSAINGMGYGTVNTSAGAQQNATAGAAISTAYNGTYAGGSRTYKNGGAAGSVFGHMIVNAPGLSANIRGIVVTNANTSGIGGMPMPASVYTGNGVEDHAFVPFLINTNNSFGVPKVVIDSMLGALDFLVRPNGTLALPFAGVCGGQCASGEICPYMACITNAGEATGGNATNVVYEGQGYDLAAGASVTLTFSGEIDYAGGHVLVLPQKGSAWRLVVIGDDGVEADTGVTAS